jgi:hypothetical protein
LIDLEIDLEIHPEIDLEMHLEMHLEIDLDFSRCTSSRHCPSTPASLSVPVVPKFELPLRSR